MLREKVNRLYYTSISYIIIIISNTYIQCSANSIKFIYLVLYNKIIIELLRKQRIIKSNWVIQQTDLEVDLE